MGSAWQCGTVLWMAGQSDTGELVHHFRYKPCGSKHCARCWPHWRDQRIARISAVLGQCRYSSLNSFLIGQIPTSQRSLKQALWRAEVPWVAIPLRGGRVAYLAGWQRDGWDSIENIETTLKRLFSQHDRSKYLTSSGDMNLGNRRKEPSGFRLVSTKREDLEALVEALEEQGVVVEWKGHDTFIIKNLSLADLESVIGKW